MAKTYHILGSPQKWSVLRRLLTLVCICLCVVLVADLSAQSTKKTILCSTSIIADMAQNIVGEEIDVQTMVPRGADPHLYEPKPSDMQRIKDADLILINGLNLERWLEKLITNVGVSERVAILTEGVQPIRSAEHEDSTDPHAWMDVSQASMYVENILKALRKAGLDSAKIEERYRDYQSKLSSLHQEIQQLIQSIPADQRLLITTHDAFSYFGRAYDLPVNPLMGISTEAEIRSLDLSLAIQKIAEKKLNCIFVEHTINPKLMRQLSTDMGINLGEPLFADALGSKDGPAATYIQMMRTNTQRIVSGLSKPQISPEKSSDDMGFLSILGFFLLLAVPFTLLAYVLNHRNKITHV